MLKPILILACCAFSSLAFAEEAVLRHLVMFQFKEGTTAEQVTEIEQKFEALEKQIDTIIDFEWGTAATTERNQGFTHCFTITFKDIAGLDTYLPHEAHQAFVAIASPHVKDLLVFDYFAK